MPRDPHDSQVLLHPFARAVIFWVSAVALPTLAVLAVVAAVDGRVTQTLLLAVIAAMAGVNVFWDRSIARRR